MDLSSLELLSGVLSSFGLSLSLPESFSSSTIFCEGLDTGSFLLLLHPIKISENTNENINKNNLLSYNNLYYF